MLMLTWLDLSHGVISYWVAGYSKNYSYRDRKFTNVLIENYTILHKVKTNTSACFELFHQLMMTLFIFVYLILSTETDSSVIDIDI